MYKAFNLKPIHAKESCGLWTNLNVVILMGLIFVVYNFFRSQG